MNAAINYKSGAVVKIKEWLIRSSVGAKLIVTGVVALASVMFVRLYFGVDTTDEGFYLAMSYLFSRGGEPFVHEVAAQQGAAIIFAPFVKLYISLIGSPEGLVIFGRHAYFLVSLLASWSIWQLCRRYASPVAALFPALLPIVFHPGGIPNISYNSLGALAWMLGLGFIYACYLPAARARFTAFYGAALLVISSFSYPSLLVVSVFVLCVSFLFSPNILLDEGTRADVQKSHRIGLLLGTSLFAIPLFYLVLKGGFEPLLSSYAFVSAASSKANQGGGISKILRIFGNLIHSWRYGAIVLFSLIIFLVPRVPKPWRWLGVISGIVLFLPGIEIFELIWSGRRLGDSSKFVVWLGLLFPLFFLSRQRLGSSKHLLVIWLISVFAGLVTAWTSSMWINGALGLMPAAVLSLFFLRMAGMSSLKQFGPYRFSLF